MKTCRTFFWLATMFFVVVAYSQSTDTSSPKKTYVPRIVEVPKTTSPDQTSPSSEPIVSLPKMTVSADSKLYTLGDKKVTYKIGESNHTFIGCWAVRDLTPSYLEELVAPEMHVTRDAKIRRDIANLLGVKDFYKDGKTFYALRIVPAQQWGMMSADIGRGIINGFHYLGCWTLPERDITALQADILRRNSNPAALTTWELVSHEEILANPKLDELLSHVAAKRPGMACYLLVRTSVRPNPLTIPKK